MAGQGGLAEKVRAGLEPEVIAPTPSSRTKVHYLDEVWVRKPIRRHVSEFSCVISLVLLIIAGVGLYKGHSLVTPVALTTTALVLLALGYRAPGVLHPVWKSWMSLATGIGLVMTTLILSLGWTILVIPFALVMRFVGKRVMDLSYATGTASYWETRDSKLDDFKLLERQF
ncbi:MAG: hypothetical protein J0M12_14275 [Deltaproteobacteria bacterium]|nr:hypothetical protein [Deltaproteobacteria bacterium]